MSDRPDRIRQESRIRVEDPDFVIRAVTFDDLERLVREANARYLPGSWSSPQAMAAQVAAQSTAFLCPVVRNGGKIDEPETYRCHIWFVQQSGGQGAVSLIDVTRRTVETLPEIVDPIALKKIIRVLCDNYPLTPLA